MAEAETPRSVILQEARRRFIEGGMRRSGWITVCSLRERMLEGIAFYSALIPKKYVAKFFEQESWDFRIGDGSPSVWEGWGRRGRFWYERFGEPTGVEPLVLYRSYLGSWKSHLEVSQEFRLYFNLFHDSRNGLYLGTDSNGEVEEVIRTGERNVEVKIIYLHRFLAAKQMHLGLFFDGDAFATESLEQLDLADGFEIRYHENDVRYRLSVHENSVDPTRGRTWSRLLGKTLIRCRARRREAPFSSRGPQTYCEFIIGVDELGGPIKHTCNPEKLAGSGKNPGAAGFLTPVHFRREVLQKYYDNPQKYEVSDANIQCGGFWSLRIDNDRPDRVIVWLGDLGRMSDSERLHWQHYNVIPEGGISRTSLLRNIHGQFADPQMPDLVFKHLYPTINSTWKAKFGFPLFLPLRDEDKHVFQTLRVPLSDNRAEFDGQILSLAKLLVDSLNEKGIEKEIEKVPGEKGIAKLERWLRKKKLPGWEPHVQFLRNLQALRGGSAHRKGENYARAAKAFQLDERPLTEVGLLIFTQAVDFLTYLRAISKRE
jgi:hypothetical protein